MEHGQEQRLFLGIDVVGYSKNPEKRLALIQHEVKSAVQKAVLKAGLDTRSWEFRGPGSVQKTGDGLLTAIPDSTAWSATGIKIPQGLSAELSEFNREREHKIRVRVALHIGPYAEGELGWSTGTPIRLARLLDSWQLKEAARGCKHADVVVAYSNEVYQHIKGSMPQADEKKLSDEKKVVGKHRSEDFVYARFLAYYAGAPEHVSPRRSVFRVPGPWSFGAAFAGLAAFAAVLIFWPGPAVNQVPAPHLKPASVTVGSNDQSPPSSAAPLSLAASKIPDRDNRRMLKLTMIELAPNETLCVRHTSVDFLEQPGSTMISGLRDGSIFPVTIGAGQGEVQATLTVHTDQGCSMDLLFKDVTPAN